MRGFFWEEQPGMQSLCLMASLNSTLNSKWSSSVVIKNQCHRETWARQVASGYINKSSTVRWGSARKVRNSIQRDAAKSLQTWTPGENMKQTKQNMFLDTLQRKPKGTNNKGTTTTTPKSLTMMFAQLCVCSPCYKCGYLLFPWSQTL